MDLTRRGFIKAMVAIPLAVYLPSTSSVEPKKNKVLFDIVDSEIISINYGLGYRYKGRAKSRKTLKEVYFMLEMLNLTDETVVSAKEEIQNQLFIHFSRRGG